MKPRAKTPELGLHDTPVVGRWYFVPTVRWTHETKHPCGVVNIPILGPLHEDAEHVGFPYEHWHIDYRFIPDSIYRGIIKPQNYGLNYPELEGRLTLGMPVLAVRTDRNVRLRRRRCARPTGLFPGATWHLELEEAHATACAASGICPHRGISLAGAPSVGGARICPGHGLAWDRASGKLVPRKALPGWPDLHLHQESAS